MLGLWVLGWLVVALSGFVKLIVLGCFFLLVVVSFGGLQLFYCL